MSQITVSVPPSLRKFVGGKTHERIQAATVRQALETFAGGSASLRDHLFDQDDGLRRFVRIFVDGKPAAIAPGRDQPLADGAEMTILLALAGG